VVVNISQLQDFSLNLTLTFITYETVVHIFTMVATEDIQPTLFSNHEVAMCKALPVYSSF